MKKHHITPRFGFIMFDKETTEEKEVEIPIILRNNWNKNGQILSLKGFRTI